METLEDACAYLENYFKKTGKTEEQIEKEISNWVGIIMEDAEYRIDDKVVTKEQFIKHARAGK